MALEETVCIGDIHDCIESHKPHPSQRGEKSGQAATIKLLP